MSGLRRTTGTAITAALGVLAAAGPGHGVEDPVDAPAAIEAIGREDLERRSPDLPSVLAVVGPLYNLCPPRASLGDVGGQERVAFVVPDGLEQLEVLKTPGTRVFPFGREGTGGVVSMVLRGKPEKLRAQLAQLEASGRITDLEDDPCREFFPEPGTSGPANCPAPDEFLEAIAVHLAGGYSDSIGAKGAVQVSPLPPSPVLDPGPRPGDEKGPTFVRAGPDGAFTLTGADGPGLVQLEAAAGCDATTTVAVAGPPAAGEAAGPTRVRGTPPPAKPGKPPRPPAAKPPPPEGASLCGPDVTDYVLGTLDFLNETFNGWDEATKNQKCTDLFNPAVANGAWEMMHFTPYDQSYGADGNVDVSKPRFFERYSAVCARPPPCNVTVEFLGRCLPAQVVNYVVWGAMNVLCDTEDLGGFMHTARNGVIELLFNGRISISPTFRAQRAMSHLGEEVIKDSRGLPAKKKWTKGLLDTYFKSFPAEFAALEGANCSCTCGEYETAGFDNLGWGFRWGLSDWYERRGGALRKP